MSKSVPYFCSIISMSCTCMPASIITYQSDAHGTWLSVGLAKNYNLGRGTWPFPVWVIDNIPFCKCKNCFVSLWEKKIQDLKNAMGISNSPYQMLWLIYSLDYGKFMLCDVVLLKQLPTAFTCNWWIRYSKESWRRQIK